MNNFIGICQKAVRRVSRSSGLLTTNREIRASERRFYLKITDIYEQASIEQFHTMSQNDWPKVIMRHFESSKIGTLRAISKRKLLGLKNEKVSTRMPHETSVRCKSAVPT